MSKTYYRVSEFQNEVLDSRTQVFERGFDIGFHSAYNYLSLKKMFTSYVYAEAFSGKTSFLFDIYMYIAKKYGAIICLYSPESGGKNALVSYLVQVYLGKKLHGREKQEATDDEWLEALAFLDKHFILLDPKVVGKNKVDFTTEVLFQQVYEAELAYNCKIDILLIDPHTMLRKSDLDRKKSISDYILDNLYYINQVAESMNIHIQIAMHSTSESTIIDKDSGIEYNPKPHPNRIANGRNVFRTGLTMMGMWRCPDGVVDKATGVPYPANTTDFFVQKNKILGAGETGNFRLHYDVVKQKFYEEIAGERYYCGEYEEMMEKVNNPTTSAMKPSTKFTDDIF